MQRNEKRFRNHNVMIYSDHQPSSVVYAIKTWVTIIEFRRGLSQMNVPSTRCYTYCLEENLELLDCRIRKTRQRAVTSRLLFVWDQRRVWAAGEGPGAWWCSATVRGCCLLGVWGDTPTLHTQLLATVLKQVWSMDTWFSRGRHVLQCVVGPHPQGSQEMTRPTLPCLHLGECWVLLHQ